MDWDAIVASESDRVWQTLWRMLGHRADVEDCFQETFVSAVRFAQRETVENWTAMLVRLATARAIDRLRLRYRRRTIDGGTHQADGNQADQPAPNANPLDAIAAGELAEQLRRAVAELPEKQAEIFSLFAIHGWTQRDIAERLEITENTVSVTVHRARSRLRQALDESGVMSMGSGHSNDHSASGVRGGLKDD